MKQFISPFVLIHSYVLGLASECDTHGFSYFVLFVDDCIRMSWVYFLKHKSKVFDAFVKFYHMILTRFQAQPQILRSDNWGEYINLNLKKFISDHGLVHQITYPDTKGAAEPKNRILLENT